MQNPVTPVAFSSTETLLQTWESIGLANPWIRNAWDPSFSKSTLCYCSTLDVLKTNLAYRNWCLGQGFYYKNLCFINQVNGGDEWLTIKDDYAFESITFARIINNNKFDILINRLLVAPKDQCIKLKY
jgi:hypothetical protein